MNNIQKSKKNQENHFFTAWTVTEGKFSFQKFELFLNYCSHGGKVEIIFKILFPTISWIYNFFIFIFLNFPFFSNLLFISQWVRPGQNRSRGEEGWILAGFKSWRLQIRRFWSWRLYIRLGLELRDVICTFLLQICSEYNFSLKDRHSIL